MRHLAGLDWQGGSLGEVAAVVQAARAVEAAAAVAAVTAVVLVDSPLQECSPTAHL